MTSCVCCLPGVAEAYSPVTGELMVHHTDAQIVDLIMHDFDGRKIALLAPVVRGRKGHYRELFLKAL